MNLSYLTQAYSIPQPRRLPPGSDEDIIITYPGGKYVAATADAANSDQPAVSDAKCKLMHLPPVFWSRMRLYLDPDDLRRLGQACKEFARVDVERYLPWSERSLALLCRDRELRVQKAGAGKRVRACYLCFRMLPRSYFQKPGDTAQFARVLTRNRFTGERTFRVVAGPPQPQPQDHRDYSVSPPPPSMPSSPQVSVVAHQHNPSYAEIPNARTYAALNLPGNGVGGMNGGYWDHRGYTEGGGYGGGSIGTMPMGTPTMTTENMAMASGYQQQQPQRHPYGNSNSSSSNNNNYNSNYDSSSYNNSYNSSYNNNYNNSYNNNYNNSYNNSYNSSNYRGNNYNNSNSSNSTSRDRIFNSYVSLRDWVPQAPGAPVGQIERLPRYCMNCAIRTGISIPGDTITSDNDEKDEKKLWLCWCRRLHAVGETCESCHRCVFK